ncbi:MAG: hypothetical protein M0010_07485, partial [Actinomycetota bacterium]|nr:hypothetical protein [Actinomycetota bacterium]
PPPAPPPAPPPPPGFTVVRPTEPIRISASPGQTDVGTVSAATDPRRSARGATSGSAETNSGQSAGTEEELPRPPAITPDFFARAGRRRH